MGALWGHCGPILTSPGTEIRNIFFEFFFTPPFLQLGLAGVAKRFELSTLLKEMPRVGPTHVKKREARAPRQRARIARASALASLALACSLRSHRPPLEASRTPPWPLVGAFGASLIRRGLWPLGV